MIKVQEWAEIRHLHFAEGLSERAEGLSERVIVDRLGMARETVRRAIAAEAPPTYSRPPAPSAFDTFEPRVRALLASFPTMPSSVLAERVGWEGSESWFRKRVALLRPSMRQRTPPTGSSMPPGIRRNAICGSRRHRSRLEPGSLGRRRCWSWWPRSPGSSPPGCFPPGRHRICRPGCGRCCPSSWAPFRSACSGTTRPASAAMVASPMASPVSPGRWRRGWSSSSRSIPSPRAWSSG